MALRCGLMYFSGAICLRSMADQNYSFSIRLYVWFGFESSRTMVRMYFTSQESTFFWYHDVSAYKMSFDRIP